jgi:hypothetical protein
MSIRKKGMIIVVSALFISLSMAPLLTAEKERTKPLYAVQLTSVAENGNLIKETLLLSDEEVQSLQSRLSCIIDLLKNQVDMDGVLAILLKFINMDDYPVVSKIISRVFDSDLLMKGKLVFSEGWSLTLNPFNDGDISFMKPFTFWNYQDGSDMFQIPSMTTIIDLDPFELKTIEGSQLGFMFRFKGIYIEITQPVPQQSFTFFLGMSRHVNAIELPNISLPEGLIN